MIIFVIVILLIFIYSIITTTPSLPPSLPHKKRPIINWRQQLQSKNKTIGSVDESIWPERPPSDLEKLDYSKYGMVVLGTGKKKYNYNINL